MSKAGGKNIARGCGLGCGGLILLLILAGIVGHFVKTPDGSDAGKTSDKAKVAAFYRLLSEVRRSLPAGGDLREQRPRACVPVRVAGLDVTDYTAVDDGWLQQFTDRGFVPAKHPRNPPPFYRDHAFVEIEGLTASMLGPHDSELEHMMMSYADDVRNADYIAVFLPLEESWPIMSSDGKSFRAGLFRGWLILVDVNKKKPIGQTEFAASSSPKIESFQIGLHRQMLLGDDLKTAMEKDFTDHFWQAAKASVTRLCGREITHSRPFI